MTAVHDAAAVAQSPATGSARRRRVVAAARRWPAIGEAGPMLWLTSVEAGARVLSFGFYLIAARVFTPGGFGVVQYTITVSLLAFGGLQVLATALMRELGAARTSDQEIRAVLGSSMAVAAGLLVVTGLLSVAAQAVGLAHGVSPVGLLWALAGTAALQLYYAIARGLGDPGRQAASYAGASLAQLVMVAALALLIRATPTDALIVFGASSFVPILLYEWRHPVLRGRALRIDAAVVRRLWMVGAPLLAAQVGYLVWNSLDQIWVQGALGSFHVGVYSAAKNVSQALLVVPAGIAGVLLPRVSQLRNCGEQRDARRLVIWATIGAAAISAAVALLIVLTRAPLLGGIYGSAYRGASGPLAVLSLGMVCYAAFTTLTMAAVGWGRPRVYTFGVASAAALEGLLLFLVHRPNLMTAAYAYSVSMAGALALVLGALALRPLWIVER